MIINDETLKTYVILFSKRELEGLLKGTQLTIPKDYLNDFKLANKINIRLYNDEGYD